MAISVASWARETASVYFGNAATTRDFRSQLRGNKPILLWMAYLGVLILVTAITYGEIALEGEHNVAAVQSRLNGFYETVIGLLGGLIALVTPSLTATTVIMERQRKSLDLVFSSPVSLKYYLVGKMLSSLRYTWMLLMLALPVTAVCVVMGGATWGDVVGAYLILTGASLVFTAFGLLVSVMATSVVSAVLWTYVTIIGYSYFISMVGIVPTVGSMVSGRSSMEQSWLGSLSPFLAGMAAPTYTMVGSWHVPNWLFAMVYSVAVCKLIVLGAGSAMCGYNAAETKSLRVHVLVYLAMLGAVLAATAPFFSPSSTPSVSPSSVSSWDVFPVTWGWLTVGLALAMSTIACFSPLADRRNRPDGFFSVRRMFTGTPGGALPFLLCMPLAFFVGALPVFVREGANWLDAKNLALAAWALGYMCLWWGVARLASGFGKPLRVARLWVGAAFLVVLVLPLPLLAGLTTSMEARGASFETPWKLYLLHPIAQANLKVDDLLVHAALMAIVGLLCAVATLRNARPALER